MSAYLNPGADRAAVGAHDAVLGPVDAIALATPAIRDALALAAILRSRDRRKIQDFTDQLKRDRLVAALVAACALLPARSDAARRLAWIDDDPSEWSDALLTAEASRYDHGDRDVTACMAFEESGRRLDALQRRAS